MRNKLKLCALIAAAAVMLCSCGKRGPDNVTPTAPSPSPSVPTAPPTSSPEPSPDTQVEPGLDELRKNAEGFICAAAYLGRPESSDKEAVRESLEASETAERFDFIKSIPDERIIVIGGEDIYCIVPVDSSASLSVRELEYDSELTAAPGDKVYENGAQPILLVCNVSDIMANSIVTVTTDGGALEFSPYISLKDGSLATDAPEGSVYDFSGK